MPEISLICFDLGGVLVRLVRDWQHALDLTFSSSPQSRPPLPDPTSPSWTQHHAHALSFEIGSLTEPEFENAIQQCFPNLPLSTYWQIFDAWLLGLYPGLPSLLADLKHANLSTAVLSNTNARHWQILHSPEYAPLQQIDHLLASHLLQCRKPDPQAYHHVEKITHKLPHQILFFDDRPENIEAAHHAGWHTHLINPTQDGIPQIRSHLHSLHLL
jgi:HAD superfamily hydrolase (TIGR01509 family)